jgi:endonuclease/exonuclease/phosphatase family metal-dependent hydrolase
MKISFFVISQKILLQRLFLVITFCAFAHVCGYGQTVKVMSYNIRYDNPQDGVNAWPNRKEKVFTLIKKYNPDLIGVQEALKHQLDEIITALPEYAYVGVGRDDGKTAGEYSAIFYRKSSFDVLEDKTFWLSNTPEVPGSKSWDAAITRVVTYAKFTHRESKKPFYLVNTHFDHIGKEARKESARMVLNKALELNKIPVIVSGDMNCTPDEDPYKILTEGKKLCDAVGRQNVGTFCSFEVNSIPCKHIDYIFHTPELRASNAEIIQDHDGKHYPSDHLPVMVSIKLK